MKTSCANKCKIYSVKKDFDGMGIRHSLNCESKRMFPYIIGAIYKFFGEGK